MKSWIVEETVSVTYFHRVMAETIGEARKNFYNGVSTEYNIKDEFYGNDTTIDIYNEEWDNNRYKEEEG